MSQSGKHHYTRFIPSEEIADIERWQFGAIAAQGTDVLASACVPADAPPADEVAVSSAEQLQRACDEAHALGLAQGQAQARQEGQQQLDEYVAGEGRQVARQLSGMLQAFEESLAGVQQRMADELLQLACDIARQVVRDELRASPRAMLPVVREALATFTQDSRPATVRLNPADWEQLEQPLREEFGGARVQWHPDTSVEPGGCNVECAGTVVDGTLETRWRRAIAALGLVSVWREMGDAD